MTTKLRIYAYSVKDISCEKVLDLLVGIRRNPSKKERRQGINPCRLFLSFNLVNKVVVHCRVQDLYALDKIAEYFQHSVCFLPVNGLQKFRFTAGMKNCFGRNNLRHVCQSGWGCNDATFKSPLLFCCP